MNIIYTKSYDQTRKKLRKYLNEIDNLNKIIDLIEQHQDFDMLVNNPITRMYHFERMKYEHNDYYSFNLSKNGGSIRLIVKPGDDKNIIELIYISYNHYEDFKNGRVIYYDE